MAIELTFPDGSTHQFPDGVTGREVAEWVGPRLARAAVAVTLDGRQLDLGRPLPSGGRFEVITEATEDGRAVLRHSAAHVLAQAVLDLFPGAHFAIGPPIEDGFYYDFDIGRPFTPEDLEKIEARMWEIIGEDQPFFRQEVGRAEALEIFADQPFKREIIESVEESEVGAGEQVTLYRNDGFVDLCRGPHLPSTGGLQAVRLLRSAGAYWRGDERRPQLQRIYGTAWESRQALAAYLDRLEEAQRRDHRKLGVELDLFSFPPELGAGLALWHPKGGLVRRAIEDYSRRTHLAHGYDLVFTPHLARSVLWETSGHLELYAENMYPGMELDDEQRYYLKPMNCPFHILIYRSKGRSYRELPLRLFELGTVYRYERSGVLTGLLRVRGLTQDDSHIFCTRDQLADELQRLLDFVLMVFRDFGFREFEADLSTRPEDYVGEEALWEEATEALRAALQQAGLEYRVAEGEGVFYGPKIDVHIRDAMGRRWQCSTLQLDFILPERFGLEYDTPENTRERPVMIHRALLGSIERFFAILVENYAGALPAWLAPVQATVLPVADRHLDYAREVAAALGELRVVVDETNETVGEKIRRAFTHKHPAVLVVGDRDAEERTVGLRLYTEDDERRGVPLRSALEELTELARPPR
ncbi:MAG: threonine--tRNA ligase [Acidimicrobiia bacterium]